MKRSLVVAIVAAVAIGTAANAQQVSQAPQTMESVVRSTWKGLHNKVLAMAKDTVFPESKLETKPIPILALCLTSTDT